MSISVKCGQCGQQYNVGDALAGKRAKCKKCGAVMSIPDPSEPVMADLSDDPLAGLSSDPLAGLGDWETAADPLGPSRLTPSPLTSASRSGGGKAAGKPKGKSAQGEGIPLAVWIGAGAGGGVLLLLLIVVLVFMLGRPREQVIPVATAGTDGAAATSGDGASPTTTSTAGTGATSGTSSGDSPAPEPAKPAVAEVNDSVAWTWQPENLPAGPEGLLSKPLGLPDNPQNLFVTRPDLAQFVASYARSGPKNETLVQRVDLKTGKTVAERSFGQYAKLLSVSPDGAAFLLLPAESYATQETLEVWRWKDAGAEQVAQWKPYEGQSSRRFAWAKMIDASRVVTHHSQDEAAIVWDASKKTPVYRVPCKGAREMLVSPDGKYLVQHAGLWLRFFHATDGRHAGSLGPLSEDYIGLAAVAFSLDGRSIAATFSAPIGGSSAVVVFDATQGRQTHAVEVPMASDRLQWVGDSFLLAGSHLVSLAHEMTVWQYVGLQTHPQATDQRAWFTARSGGETYLSAAAVPSSEVAAKIGAFVAANVPILQAGDSVSLQVTVSSQSARSNLQQELTESFRGKLAATGYQVAEDQPFRLRVDLTEEDSGRQLEYQTFGTGGTPSKLQVPDRRLVCKVAFVDKGNQEVWAQSTSVGPAFMSSNRGGGGDLVTQILQDRWRQLDFWTGQLQITKRVLKLSSTGKFGQSMLQPSGERIINVTAP